MILNDSVNNNTMIFIYIITEKEHLKLLPKKEFRIVLTADLKTIRERFKLRMNGNFLHLIIWDLLTYYPHIVVPLSLRKSPVAINEIEV